MPEAWNGLRRARPEEGADRLVRLDLADEHHAIILGDAEIGGLAGAFHQLLHDDAGAVDQLAAPQERRAHAVGLDADRPELLGSVELDHAVTGERGQHAVGGRRREVRPLGDLAERQPVGLRDDRQDACSARSSDCTAFGSAGALKARGRPRRRFSIISMSRIIKNFFGNWNIAWREKPKSAANSVAKSLSLRMKNISEKIDKYGLADALSAIKANGD